MIFVLIRTLFVLHLVHLDDKTELLEHIMHPVSVTCVFFFFQSGVVYPAPNPPTLRIRGSLFVQSLPFHLFGIGDPTKNARLQLT